MAVGHHLHDGGEPGLWRFDRSRVVRAVDGRMRGVRSARSRLVHIQLTVRRWLNIIITFYEYFLTSQPRSERTPPVTRAYFYPVTICRVLPVYRILPGKLRNGQLGVVDRAVGRKACGDPRAEPSPTRWRLVQPGPGEQVALFSASEAVDVLENRRTRVTVVSGNRKLFLPAGTHATWRHGILAVTGGYSSRGALV